MFLNHKELDFLKTPMLYKGVIEDNNDPQGFGRVRVRILGLHNDDKEAVPVSTLPWASIARSLDFGGLKAGVGISSIPQTGTWVYLFFEFSETGQYDKPVIIGAISGIDYGSQSLETDYMTKHTILTPLNHMIQIDDGNAEMRTLHDNGCEVLLNPQGITTTSTNNTNIVTVNDFTTTTLGTTNHNTTGSTNITSGASVNLSAGTTIAISASGDISIASSNGCEIQINSNGISIVSTNATNVITLNDLTTTTLGTVNHNSTGSCNITSGASINISSANPISINSGSDINITSGGKLTLTSSANTMVI